MPKRCSIAVYPTRRNVLEGVQYLCYRLLSAVVFGPKKGLQIHDVEFGP